MGGGLREEIEMYYRIKVGCYDFKEKSLFKSIHIVKELKALRYGHVQLMIVFDFNGGGRL